MRYEENSREQVNTSGPFTCIVCSLLPFFSPLFFLFFFAYFLSLEKKRNKCETGEVQVHYIDLQATVQVRHLFTFETEAIEET